MKALFTLAAAVGLIYLTAPQYSSASIHERAVVKEVPVRSGSFTIAPKAQQAVTQEHTYTQGEDPFKAAKVKADSRWQMVYAAPYRDPFQDPVPPPPQTTPDPVAPVPPAVSPASTTTQQKATTPARAVLQAPAVQMKWVQVCGPNGCRTVQVPVENLQYPAGYQSAGYSSGGTGFYAGDGTYYTGNTYGVGGCNGSYGAGGCSGSYGASYAYTGDTYGGFGTTVGGGGSGPIRRLLARFRNRGGSCN